MSAPLSLIVFGATGAIGREVIQLAKGDHTIGHVHAVMRRPSGDQSDSITEHALDTVLSGAATDWGNHPPATVAMVCLGTTLRQAGSVDAFQAVDRDLVLQVADWCVRENIQSIHIISALGADASKRHYYNRTKGQMEQGVRDRAIPTTVFYQPSLLYGATRTDARRLEGLGYYPLRALTCLPGLKLYAPIHVQTVAKAMLAGTGSATKGCHWVRSQIMQTWASNK